MVNVEVRSKKTYLNRSVLEEQARVHAAKKLDRHKQRGRAAERIDASAAREHEAGARRSASALRSRSSARPSSAAAPASCEEEAKRRADEEARVARRRRGAPPGARRASARKRSARQQARGRQAGASRARAERERARIQRAELHVSSDASARFKKKKQHQASRSRRPVQVNVSTQHGFERPAAPVKRDVQIGETITVAELAQRMAVKANEVIKVMMNMGVMATINQPIDQDTAVLVVEELGHTAVVRQGKRDRRRAAGAADAAPRAAAAAAGRHHHGPRRPRQDLAARLHPPHQGRRGRSGRHHAAHRRVPRRNAEGRDHVPRYAGPRGVHGDACARRAGDGHRRAGRRRRRRRHAADGRSDPACARGRSADRRGDQQDRQGRRRPGEGQERPGQAQRAARGLGRRHACSSTCRRGPARASTSCSTPSCCRPKCSS